MKGDFSRRTFDPEKHYSAVLQEQGRMLTDADLEEEHRILAHRIEKGAADLIGGCGAPIGDAAGFEITAAEGDLAIGWGTYYVDGIRVRNPNPGPDGSEDPPPEAPTLTGQPYRHDVAWPPEEPGWYHIYLDVWRRLVTALDDPDIREVALGGPTTAAREQTIWQVRAIRAERGDEEREPHCLDPLPDPGATTGRLAAQADPEVATTGPCEVPASAGFKGLENQFYRVEVHATGDACRPDEPPEAYEIAGFSDEKPAVITLASRLPDEEFAVGSAVELVAGNVPETNAYAHIVSINDDRDQVTLSVDVSGMAEVEDPRLRRAVATYVWSRDNGSVVTTIDRIDGAEITVRDLGRDDVLGFAPDQWVEITDDVNDFERRPGQLRRIESIDVARQVVVLSAAIDPLEPVDPADPEDPGVDPERHPKLRRWDGAGEIVFDTSDEPRWLPLEDGIAIRFSEGRYRTGDWWHFPARTATIDPDSGNIDWPEGEDGPALLPPQGIEHHTCRLALVEVTGIDEERVEVGTLVDCRNLFPPVTELTNLLYVSGDGQEVMPVPGNNGPVPLGAPLEVRVANGAHPVRGASVKFAIHTENVPGDDVPDYPVSDGRLQNGNLTLATVETNDDGIARCIWHLDSVTPAQTCMARLLDAAGVPIDHQVVVFHASLSTADRVAYTPSGDCDDLASATTVQAAIDLLCQRETAGGGRCCCVSVGRGGEYKDIATAIEELRASNEQGICLCLLPGDHVLPDLDLDLSSGERAVSLSIAGCGRASRLHLLKGARLRGLREFALRRLDIGVEPGSAIDVRQAHTVIIDECRIAGVPEGRGLVRVQGATRIEVASSTLEAIHGGSFEIVAGILEGLDMHGASGLAELFTARRLLRDFDPRAREVAHAFLGMGPDARRALAKALLDRTASMGSSLSLGETIAWRRLAEALSREPYDLWSIVDHLLGIRIATGRAAPGVALEVGNMMPEGGGEPDYAATRHGAVMLENNDIVGLVSFYGLADLGQELPEELLSRLWHLLREGGARPGGADLAVHVRNNHLTRLAIGSEFANQILDWFAHESTPMGTWISGFHATDNIVDGVHSAIAARHVSFAHNQFTLAALRDIGGRDAERVADVIGDSAIYTGNQGQRTGFGFTVGSWISDITRTSAQAANLDIDFVV